MHVKVEGIKFGVKEWRWRLRGCSLRLKGWRFTGIV